MAVEEKKRARDIRVEDSVVRECLEKILGSPAFRASNRPKQFLSFVVERTLEGRQDEIKERTIGAEVFGRTADFETSGDSIVRVNANEVRRRLAQYYQDRATRDPVQIILPAGTYVPEFVVARDAAPTPQVVQPAVGEVAGHGSIRLSRRFWLSGIAAAMVATVWLTFAAWHPATAFDRFWSPVLSTRTAPILCLPTSDTYQLSSQTARELNELKPGEYVRLTRSQAVSFHNWHTSLPVLQAALNISAALQHYGRTPLVRIGTDLKMDELRGHPVIAIGSFSNPWTRQNVAGLRFTFDRGASDEESPRIRDSQNPQRSWSLPHVFPDAQDKDYAIVTRTFHPTTREPFVSLAGLHSFGCQIGGEFVSQPSFWNDLSARAPAGWEKMNVQVVLETNVIGITPSTPKVVDMYFWK